MAFWESDEDLEGIYQSISNRNDYDCHYFPASHNICEPECFVPEVARHVLGEPSFVLTRSKPFYKEQLVYMKRVCLRRYGTQNVGESEMENKIF